jgi:hypothetical protein
MNRLVATVVIALSIAGCAGKNEPQYNGPHLVSFADAKRAKIGTASGGNGTYANMMDRLDSLAQDVYVPNRATVSDTIVNQGKASKGVRVTIKGTALDQGLLGAPETLELTGATRDSAGKENYASVTLNVEGNAQSGYKAEAPDFAYGKEFRLALILPTAKGGEGELDIFVYPMDTKGETTCIIRRKFNVLSDGSEAVQ